MSNTEIKDLIEIEQFNICLINNTAKASIIEMYPTRKDGAYYLDKFANFLNDNYKISLRDYCEQYLGISWPKCPISGEKVGYKIGGKGLKLSKFKRGCISKDSCENFKLACEKMSTERMGEKNPMFGAIPWNKDKDKRNPIIKRLAENRTGTKASNKTKTKQSESAKKRKIHGHTGHKHSKKTKNILREQAAKKWASGIFQKVTSIHIKVRDYLKTLNLTEQFQEEYQVKYFSMDFAFPTSKVAVECQGTFFHVDPRVYPNGPVCAIQRRNFGRDKAKRKVCCNQQGWSIIELWETEINDGQFKEILKCKLLESNLLNQ